MKLGTKPALLALLAIYCVQIHSERAVGREMNAHDFDFKSIDGDPMPLSKFP